VPIDVPASAEYVALGAARQAASALHGGPVDWAPRGVESYEAEHRPEALARYRDLSGRVASAMNWA